MKRILKYVIIIVLTVQATVSTVTIINLNTKNNKLQNEIIEIQDFIVNQIDFNATTVDIFNVLSDILG